MTSNIDTHKKWISHALTLAKRAASENEVPVGAVIVYQDEIIGEGWNQPITHKDPTAHAEIMAMRAAAKTLNNYRLLDTTLYVTLEPCTMCVGAMIHARIGQLVYGATDPKAGAVESVAELLDSAFFNHKIPYQAGVMSEECGVILSQFFQTRRKEKADKSV